MTATPTGGTQPGDLAYAIALTELGKPYVNGAVGPSGFDCSGLTEYCYVNGPHLAIGRNTTAQWISPLGSTIWDVAANGPWPSTGAPALQAGDLIFYGAAGSSGPNAHVQIYSGIGTVVIEAPFTGTNVRTANYNFQQGGSEPFKGIRRYGGGGSGGASTAFTSGIAANTTQVSPADLLAATADNAQSTATVDLPDPRNNKPFSPAFLGQAVPGGSLGGFRFDAANLGTKQGGISFVETGLVRGGLSEMDLNGARPRGPFQVFFMINPESISFDYQIQTDLVPPQAQSTALQQISSYPVQNQGVSFNIVFNRMYEVWQGNYPGPSDIGCRWDVRAIERLMGLFDDTIGVKGLGKFETGGYAPLGLPVICVFGGPNSFQFQGRINSLSVQYTMFDRNMIPIEAQVSISLLKVYINNEKNDLSTPLVQTYDPSFNSTNPPLKVGGPGGGLKAQ